MRKSEMQQPAVLSENENASEAVGIAPPHTRGWCVQGWGGQGQAGAVALWNGELPGWQVPPQVESTGVPCRQARAGSRV